MKMAFVQTYRITNVCFSFLKDRCGEIANLAESGIYVFLI